MENLVLGINLITPCLFAIFMWWFEKNDRKRDERMKEMNDIKREERLLSLDLSMASSKLAYAVAMALKRGQYNGEIEEVVKVYEASRKKYLEFISTQAISRIN